MQHVSMLVRMAVSLCVYVCMVCLDANDPHRQVCVYAQR